MCGSGSRGRGPPTNRLLLMRKTKKYGFLGRLVCTIAHRTGVPDLTTELQSSELLHVRTRRALALAPPAPTRVPPIWPPSAPATASPQLQSACHQCHTSGPRACHPSGNPRRAPAQIRMTPIQPGAFLFSRREPQTLLFGVIWDFFPRIKDLIDFPDFF